MFDHGYISPHVIGFLALLAAMLKAELRREDVFTEQKYLPISSLQNDY